LDDEVGPGMLPAAAQSALGRAATRDAAEHWKHRCPTPPGRWRCEVAALSHLEVSVRRSEARRRNGAHSLHRTRDVSRRAREGGPSPDVENRAARAPRDRAGKENTGKFWCFRDVH